MKNQISRLIALGGLAIVAIGFLGTDQGQANFSGTTWGWPYPASQGYLGQGSVWNWNGSSYTNGWSLARWIGTDPNNLSWNGRYSLNSSSSYVTFDSGTAATHNGYRLVEYYWDGSTYDYGESNISPHTTGHPWTNGGCD